jgi:hypothetical protein
MAQTKDDSGGWFIEFCRKSRGGRRDRLDGVYRCELARAACAAEWTRSGAGRELPGAVRGGIILDIPLGFCLRH